MQTHVGRLGLGFDLLNSGSVHEVLQYMSINFGAGCVAQDGTVVERRSLAGN